MESSEMGLRELKKQMTRQSLAEAAAELTMERGIENVTIDEIARRAFVSPRTFSNYFSCKEEAVVAVDAPLIQKVLDAFVASSTDEPVLSALRRAMVDAIESMPAEDLLQFRERMELEEGYTTLRAYRVAQYDSLESGLREAIANKLQLDVTRMIYPWLVAAAAVNVIRTAVQLWVRAGDGSPDPLPQIIGDAFHQIGAGLPGPKGEGG